MRNVSFPTVGFSLLALAVSTAVQAADDTKLEQVVVTATRTEQPIDKVLAPVTVFERKDIERLQVQNLSELFTHVAGVSYRTDGGPGANASISMRGTNSAHTLVLIDGIRVEAATTGQSSLEYLRPNDIERIEVVRGPRAALYGSDAIGGVIQIFTRSGGGHSGGEFKVGYGSHQTSDTSASAGWADDESRINFTAGQYDRNGFSRVEPTDHNAVTSDNDAYRNTSGSLHMSHKFDGDSSVRLNYRRSEGKSEFDGSDWSFYPLEIPTYPYTDFEQESGSLAYHLPVTDVWSSDLSYGEAKDEQLSKGLYVDASRHERYFTHRRMANWQNDVAIADDIKILAGLEYIRDDIETQSTYAVRDTDKKAAFLQYQGVMDAFSWVAGARHDDNEHFGEKDTWSVEGGYEVISDVRVVASMGTSFRAPSMNDLYYPMDGWFMVGNPHLQPEEATSRELALRGAALGLDSFGISVFHTSVDHLINWVYDPDTFITSPQNVDKARIDGLELEAVKTFGEWRLGGSASWLQPEDRATGKRLITRPKRFGNLDIDRELGRWTLGASLYAQGDVVTSQGRELGGYGSLGVRASYAVLEDLTVGLKVENLGEKHYRQNGGYTDPYNAEDGMEAMLSVTYSPKW